jgi:hypothetical protein
MDQATQQNAALVEQMAAAASGLRSQADDLVHVVDAFKLGESQPSLSQVPSRIPTSQKVRRQPAMKAPAPKARHLPPKPAAAKPVALPQPAAKAKVTPAGGDDDWETF